MSRRRRKVAAEARTRGECEATARASPVRRVSAGVSTTREAAARATGPRTWAAAGPLTGRAQVGRGDRRCAIRIRRPVIRSVVRIAAMKAPPWGRLVRDAARSLRARCRSAVTVWIKSRGCDTRFRPGFSVLLIDRGSGRGSADCGCGWFGWSNARSDPLLDHERPFVVKTMNERMFVTNTRSCYLLHQPGGHNHE